MAILWISLINGVFAEASPPENEAPAGTPLGDSNDLEAFMKDKAPEFMEHLSALRSSRPAEVSTFLDTLSHLHQQYMKEEAEDPVTARRRFQYERGELRSKLMGETIQTLHEKNREHPTEETARQIKEIQSELRQLLNDLFDMKLEFKREELARARREVKALESEISVKAEQRNEVIERRLNILSGSDDELEW
jgi:hypothetical protein